MQIILSKSAFFLVKKDFNECGYDYDLIIIKSRLRKLECPHCHRQLACSGYYLRTIITAKGKKIIRIPRLQCGNRECVYKITRHLKTPPIIKPTIATDENLTNILKSLEFSYLPKTNFVVNAKLTIIPVK